MCHLWTSGLFMLSFVCTSSVQTVVCPLQCHCEHRRDSHVINCSDKNLTSLPFLCGLENDNSHRMVEFYANRNHFRHILKNSFYHVRERLRHLEIVSNAFSIDLARFAFDSFVDSLQILKLEPVSEDINVLVDSFKKLTKLKVLHLISRSDEFQSLSTRFLQPDLVEFSLQKSDLKNISYGVFSNIGLKILNLNHNHLNDFPVELVRIIARSVSVLYLSANEITELGDPDIPLGCRLVYLDLSFNRISTIDEGVLERCVHLKYFNLSHNPSLMSLGNAVFDGLTGLHLDASHTSISGLDFVKPEVLVDLFVFGTNVQCSCDVQVGHYEALNGHLKGTCWTKQKIVYIQSNPLNCSQYRQRQKRYRFSIDTDHRSETGNIFGWTSSFLGGDEFTEDVSDHNLDTDLHEDLDDFHWKNSEENTDNVHDKEIVHTEHDDIFTAQASRGIETIDSPRFVNVIETFEEPDQISVTSSFESHHPSSYERSSSSESSTDVTLSSHTPTSLNIQLDSQVSTTSDTISHYNDRLDGKLTTSEMDVYTSEHESHTLKKEGTSGALNEITDLATDTYDASIIKEVTTPSVQELFIATTELFTVTPLLSEIRNDENVAISEKPDLSTESIYCTQISSHRENAENSPPSTSSIQPSEESVHHRDNCIQPSTTINVINQISSTVTYKRDFTYVIRHVNNMNPQFFPSPHARPPSSPDESHTRASVSPSATSSHIQADAKSTDSDTTYAISKPEKAYTYEECQAVMKEHVTSLRKQTPEISEDARQISEEDVQSAESIGWHQRFPVYLIACCIHACLLFAAFLKVDRGVKTKL